MCSLAGGWSVWSTSSRDELWLDRPSRPSPLASPFVLFEKSGIVKMIIRKRAVNSAFATSLPGCKGQNQIHREYQVQAQGVKAIEHNLTMTNNYTHTTRKEFTKFKSKNQRFVENSFYSTTLDPFTQYLRHPTSSPKSRVRHILVNSPPKTTQSTPASSELRNVIRLVGAKLSEAKSFR